MAMMTYLRSFSFVTVVLLALTMTVLVSGCSEYEQVNKAVESGEKEADQALQRISPKPNIRTPLVVDNRPWYGSAAIPMLNGNPLPAAYQRDNSIVLTFTEPVRLDRAAQMIQSVTGIRVQIGQSVLGQNARARQDEPVRFLPVDADEVTGGRFVWQGRLSNLLDQIGDTFGADWSYDGRMIRFDSEVTRTFMLHALATTMTGTSSIESGAAEGASALPELQLGDDTTLEIWDEVEDAITTIVGRFGEAAFSPSTGTITVTSTPEIVRRVENYLSKQNEMRLRRVSVAIKVLNVTLSNNYNFGTNASGIVAQILRNNFLAVESSAEGLTTVLRRNKVGSPDYVAAASQDDIFSSLNLSEEIDRISIVHSGAVVTLSDQPAPLQVGRQIAYLERVSSTSGDGGGQVSLEPGTVNEGLTMIALPRIVEKDRIMLRLSVAITDAQEPFATFGQGGEDGGGADDALVIQLPEIETTGFLQNAVLRSGETMVLAGFERKQNSSNDTGTPGGLWTGGDRGTSRSRNLTVLLLTAEILPEDPMTIVGR